MTGQTAAMAEIKAEGVPVHPSGPKRADRRRGIAIGLMLLAVYLVTMGGHTYSIDDEGYLAGSRALLHGTVELDQQSDLTGKIAATRSKDGEWTSIAAIGVLILDAPGVALGRVASFGFPADQREDVIRLGFLATNSVLTALTGMVLFFLCRRLGSSRRAATILALAFGLGTFAWPHSATGFSEPGTALMLTLAMLVSVRWWEERSWRLAALVGLLAGCVGLTRVTTFVFVPVFLLAGIVGRARFDRRETIRQSMAFGAGSLVVFLVFAANSYIRFGKLGAGYSGLELVTPFYTGMFGLFLSPGKGLVFYAPIVIVVLFALRQSYLANRRYALVVLAIMTLHLVVYSRLVFWAGDDAYGPRYLIPLLPICIALLAPVLDTGRQWIRGAIVAGVAGFLVPGLLGSLMYFNAVGWAQRSEVMRERNTTKGDWLQAQLVTHFNPSYSPLMSFVRSVPLLGDSISEQLAGDGISAESVPDTFDTRLNWYAGSIQPDFWWWWWALKDGSALLYAFLLVPVAALISSVLLFREPRRAGEQD
ncbi:MAG: hypothetical protein F2585_02985 [Actinobacteria bacterium]|nr:hypothetical protein [Actinomycetota bacterium]